jgi:hypothetical protein
MDKHVKYSTWVHKIAASVVGIISVPITIIVPNTLVGLGA